MPAPKSTFYPCSQGLLPEPARARGRGSQSRLLQPPQVLCLPPASTAILAHTATGPSWLWQPPASLQGDQKGSPSPCFHRSWDWGKHTPVFTLTMGRVSGVDSAFPLPTAQSKQELGQESSTSVLLPSSPLTARH